MCQPDPVNSFLAFLENLARAYLKSQVFHFPDSAGKLFTRLFFPLEEGKPKSTQIATRALEPW